MTGKALCRLMRQYRVTIREASHRLGIPMTLVRHRRQHGLPPGSGYVRDWVQAITGHDPDAAQREPLTRGMGTAPPRGETTMVTRISTTLSQDRDGSVDVEAYAAYVQDALILAYPHAQIEVETADCASGTVLCVIEGDDAEECEAARNYLSAQWDAYTDI